MKKKNVRVIWSPTELQARIWRFMVRDVSTAFLHHQPPAPDDGGVSSRLFADTFARQLGDQGYVRFINPATPLGGTAVAEHVIIISEQDVHRIVGEGGGKLVYRMVVDVIKAMTQFHFADPVVANPPEGYITIVFKKEIADILGLRQLSPFEVRHFWADLFSVYGNGDDGGYRRGAQVIPSKEPGEPALAIVRPWETRNALHEYDPNTYLFIREDMLAYISRELQLGNLSS